MFAVFRAPPGQFVHKPVHAKLLVGKNAPLVTLKQAWKTLRILYITTASWDVHPRCATALAISRTMLQVKKLLVLMRLNNVPMHALLSAPRAPPLHLNLPKLMYGDTYSYVICSVVPSSVFNNCHVTSMLDSGAS